MSKSHVKHLCVQVKHSYGAKPNEDFLQYYGFVDTDNIHDTYSIDLLEWLKRRYQLLEDSVEAVEADSAALHELQHVSRPCCAVICVTCHQNLVC